MVFNKDNYDRERKLNRAKKEAKKRGRDDRAPRQRHWKGEEEAGFERIMPRDERDRRKAVEKLADTIRLDSDKNDEGFDIPENAVTGRVIEVSTGLCRVEVDDTIITCTLRGSLTRPETGYTNVVTVNDRVSVLLNGAKGGVVVAVAPRQNVLARPDVFYQHLQHALAANLDQVLIVAAWRNPSLWPELIDRYRISAQRQNLHTILCINKVDLVEDILDLESYTEVYEKLGLQLILTSTVTGAGIEELREALAEKTTVLTGMSGVGKSSLLSAAQPGFQLRTGEVSEASGEGKHTTTQSTMLPFGEDGYVIDTPGIREFGLRGMDMAELVSHYPEFAPHLSDCRFRSCTHTHEPECGVRKAVERRQIPAWRYRSYEAIFETFE
jgi:ribosome biogenesis GTPase / thiamine phosphate phosphatase